MTMKMNSKRRIYSTSCHHVNIHLLSLTRIFSPLSSSSISPISHGEHALALLPFAAFLPLFSSLLPFGVSLLLFRLQPLPPSLSLFLLLLSVEDHSSISARPQFEAEIRPI